MRGPPAEPRGPSDKLSSPINARVFLIAGGDTNRPPATPAGTAMPQIYEVAQEKKAAGNLKVNFATEFRIQQHDTSQATDGNATGGPLLVRREKAEILCN